MFTPGLAALNFVGQRKKRGHHYFIQIYMYIFSYVRDEKTWYSEQECPDVQLNVQSGEAEGFWHVYIFYETRVSQTSHCFDL